jgi:hypothetical protein
MVSSVFCLCRCGDKLSGGQRFSGIGSESKGANSGTDSSKGSLYWLSACSSFCDAMLTDTKGHGPRTPGQTATAQDPHIMQEYTMIRSKRDAKQHAKARQRRYLQAQERLERDRRQAQQAAEALEQTLHDLGIPTNLVAEIEGRLGLLAVLEQKTTILWK